MAKKKKKKKSNVVLNIIIVLVFLAGAGVFLYPTISDMWNQYRNAQLVSKYEEAVTELSDNDYDRLWTVSYTHLNQRKESYREDSLL